MMELACHAWAFTDRSLEDMLGTVARLGFRNVDFASGPHLDFESAAAQPGVVAQHIRSLLQYYHLNVTDLYLMLPYINAPEPERREEQLDQFKKLLPFASAMGTPGITISPGILHKDGPDHSLARSIPALLEIVQATDDLRISFEPHMDSAVMSPEQALLVVEAVPGLSITLDYAHFIVQGYSLADIRPLLQHTSHIQIRQAVKGRLQTPFDQGRIDLNVLMNDLAREDYHGGISIEYMTTVGWHGMMPVNTIRETVKTRDALRQIRSGLVTVRQR
jgi:sugar phosphate isomerase/epimerase